MLDHNRSLITQAIPPVTPEGGDATAGAATATNPSNLLPEEYFDPSVDLQSRDIGRPKEEVGVKFFI